MSDPVLNDSGMTELHRAAYHGEPDWVVGCIAGGLDVNAPSSTGYTPLHWAVDMGRVGTEADRIAVVRALVEAGADLEAKNSMGETPTMTARRCTNEYLMPHLVKRDSGQAG